MYPDALRMLHDEYDRLLAEFQAGHVDAPTAMSTIAGLSVVDATGAAWGITDRGTFTRASYPGADPVETNPSEFVEDASSLPPQPAFPAPVLPGTAGNPVGFGMPPQAGAFGDDSAMAEAWNGASVIDNTEPGQKRKTRRPKERTMLAGESPVTLALERIKNLALANKLFVAILAVGLVLIVAGSFIAPRLGGGDAPGTQMPTTPPNAAGPAAPKASGDLPTAKDAATVLAVLQTGTAQDITGVIDAKLTPASLLHTQALWAGMARTDAVITPGAAAHAKGSTIVQEWVITRGDANDVVTAIKVRWVNAKGQWKLTAPPTFGSK